jgi:DNA-binding CsgD family transcriptional regulator
MEKLKSIAPLSVAETRIAQLLAGGLSRKEIATKLYRSEHTINEQARCAYRKTGSRNLADITRWLIQRYSGIPVSDILINAMRDITVGVAVGLFTWLITRPGALAEIAAGLQNWFK